MKSDQRFAPGVCPKCGEFFGRALRGHTLRCGQEPVVMAVADDAVERLRQKQRIEEAAEQRKRSTILLTRPVIGTMENSPQYNPRRGGKCPKCEANIRTGLEFHIRNCGKSLRDMQREAVAAMA